MYFFDDRDIQRSVYEDGRPIRGGDYGRFRSAADERGTEERRKEVGICWSLSVDGNWHPRVLKFCRFLARTFESR